MNPQSSEKIREFLEKSGVKIIACTFVDNAGITRVKAIPVNKLASATRNGIGISTLFAVFGTNDHITSTTGFDTPSGDMRLIPDLSAIVPLAEAPGWAWAPVWQYDQEMNVMPVCQRYFVQKMVEKAAEKGISFKMTYEVEFTLLDENNQPVGKGLPGYGITKLVPLEDFFLTLSNALEIQGISISQIHPEYAAGQYELSVDPQHPLAAVDQYLLLRQTICRVAKNYGFNASFAPVVYQNEVGNGCHIHFSAWSKGNNLFTGGNGVQDLTLEGEHMVAGVLDRMREMLAILAPSVLSYERLKPGNWAGAYTCWGLENREAPLRLCKGTKQIRSKAANFELKCIDGTVNPYLVVGIIIAAALDGLTREIKLPEEIQIDPQIFSEEEKLSKGVKLLGSNLQEAIDLFQNSDFVKQALGEPLFDSYLAVKKFDLECYKDMSLEEIIEDVRFRYA